MRPLSTLQWLKECASLFTYPKPPPSESIVEALMTCTVTSPLESRSPGVLVFYQSVVDRMMKCCVSSEEFTRWMVLYSTFIKRIYLFDIVPFENHFLQRSFFSIFSSEPQGRSDTRLGKVVCLFLLYSEDILCKIVPFPSPQELGFYSWLGYMNLIKLELGVHVCLEMHSLLDYKEIPAVYKWLDWLSDVELRYLFTKCMSVRWSSSTRFKQLRAYWEIRFKKTNCKAIFDDCLFAPIRFEQDDEEAPFSVEFHHFARGPSSIITSAPLKDISLSVISILFIARRLLENNYWKTFSFFVTFSDFLSRLEELVASQVIVATLEEHIQKRHALSLKQLMFMHVTYSKIKP